MMAPYSMISDGNDNPRVNRLFSEVADDHAPAQRRRVKGTPLPWINSKRRINERTRLVSSKSTEIELSDTLEHLQETEEQVKPLSKTCQDEILL